MLAHPDVLVPGRAVDGPRRSQRLARGEDLLDEQPAVVTDATAEARQVGLGLREAVDVVDADAGEGRVISEASRDRVDHLGDGGYLGAHGDEVVDREEPPDIAGRVPPPLQPVVLTGNRVRDIELLGARSERKAQRPVPQLGPAISLTDRQAIRSEELIERVAELGHDHRAVGRIPVDVEPRRRGRVRAVAQHLPPSVVQMGIGHRHVIRDVVDHHAETAVVSGGEQRGQPVLAAEVGTHPGVVDHVVAVHAAGNRFSDRREIQVAHAERDQMIEDADRLGEPERRRQLDPVRGDRRRLGSGGHPRCLPTATGDHSRADRLRRGRRRRCPSGRRSCRRRTAGGSPRTGRRDSSRTARRGGGRPRRAGSRS